MKTHYLLFEEREELYRRINASPKHCALSNFITNGYLIVKAAEFRKGSSGLQYNIDHPDKSILLKNIVL